MPSASFACSDVMTRWPVSAASTDVFAVGANDSRSQAVLMHYDGSSWSTMKDETDQYWFNSVWGTSHSDVFVVGGSWVEPGWSFGSVLHYDGYSWTGMELYLYLFPPLAGVWGSSHSDVFAVGDDEICHYDGGRFWSVMERWQPADDQLASVWGTSHSDVFVGVNGTILHYDGSVWSPMGSGTSESLGSVWGTLQPNE